MVTLTARAGALLRSHQAARADSLLPRLTAVAGAFSIGSSAPATDDEVVCHAGTPVLLVARDAAAALDGQILTTREREERPVLVIMPPATPRTRRGRTLQAGGRAQRVPMMAASLRADIDVTPWERPRLLVTDDASSGGAALERAYCDACQQVRPAAGSAQDGRYTLCNTCVLDYTRAGVIGRAVTTGQFVRDRVFGESTAYLLRMDAEDILVGADVIRPLTPPAARDQRSPRVNIKDRGAAMMMQRAVIRLPRHRSA